MLKKNFTCTVRCTLASAATFLMVSLLSTGYANAQRVSEVEFQVRTGDDDLRGGNDNAFVRLRTVNGNREEQLNVGNIKLKDKTTTRRRVRVPASTDLRDIYGLEIFVEGFGGGINGDNWNVAGLRVFAILAEGGDVRLADENNLRIRFTSDFRSWFRRCNFNPNQLPCDYR